MTGEREAVRRVDARTIMERDAGFHQLLGTRAMYDALVTLILDEKTRGVLDLIEPEAVQKARAALCLT